MKCVWVPPKLLQMLNWHWNRNVHLFLLLYRMYTDYIKRNFLSIPQFMNITLVDLRASKLLKPIQTLTKLHWSIEVYKSCTNQYTSVQSVNGLLFCTQIVLQKPFYFSTIKSITLKKNLSSERQWSKTQKRSFKKQNFELFSKFRTFLIILTRFLDENPFSDKFESKAE